jgi:hypothetical protein
MHQRGAMPLCVQVHSVVQIGDVENKYVRAPDMVQRAPYERSVRVGVRAVQTAGNATTHTSTRRTNW